ncbi:hypothetical protein BREVNS_0244 [Brevinematales bacterium NS]|nr:hypothetical protein BREVNS_0244 [Brevinematales bacterium NS]
MYVLEKNSEMAFFLEPHSCTPKDVDVILKKYKWLKGKLGRELSDMISDISEDNIKYYWIPIGGNDIPKHVPQYRRLCIESPIVIAKKFS